MKQLLNKVSPLSLIFGGIFLYFSARFYDCFQSQTMLEVKENTVDLPTGDHLPKKVTSETIARVEKILKGSEDVVFYDRPGENGQSLLAHKTPGSEVAMNKYRGIPS